MHCVYEAYADHLRFLGIEPDEYDRAFYHILKIMVQGPKPQRTWGGLVPFLYGVMVNANDLRLVVQTRIVTEAHYLADADSLVKRWLVRLGDFGQHVDQLTLQPAVYLWLPGQHAMFKLVVPSLKVVMALQLQRKEKSHESKSR
jgi:hypothetical protein